MEMQLIEKNIDEIIIKDRIRDDVGDVAALESSIKEFGLLYPIVVNKESILISGLRRLETCKKMGYKKIQTLIIDADEGIASLEMECQENLCRKTLTDIELDKIIEMKKTYLPPKYKSEKKGLVSKILNKVLK